MKLRYPSAPNDFTAEQKTAWNSLIRQLDRERQGELFGNPNSIQVNQIKDGVFMKGFTTVSASPYYTTPSDGTILAYSSASTCNIYLTSAVNSRYSLICIKKVDGNGGTNPVIIWDRTSAAIDSGTAVTVSATNGSIVLECDGKQWYVIARYL